MKKKPLFKFLAAACLATVLVVSSLLSACCGGAPRNRVVAGFTDGPSTLNPFWAQRYPQTAFVGLIYEPLVYSMEDGSIEAGLADTWTQSADGLEWTVHINTLAKWSDGVKVTADDVIYTLGLHWQNDGEWSQARNNKALLKKNEAGDPATDAV